MHGSSAPPPLPHQQLPAPWHLPASPGHPRRAGTGASAAGRAPTWQPWQPPPPGRRGSRPWRPPRRAAAWCGTQRRAPQHRAPLPPRPCRPARRRPWGCPAAWGGRSRCRAASGSTRPPPPGSTWPPARPCLQGVWARGARVGALRARLSQHAASGLLQGCLTCCQLHYTLPEGQPGSHQTPAASSAPVPATALPEFTSTAPSPHAPQLPSAARTWHGACQHHAWRDHEGSHVPRRHHPRRHVPAVGRHAGVEHGAAGPAHARAAHGPRGARHAAPIAPAGRLLRGPPAAAAARGRGQPAQLRELRAAQRSKGGVRRGVVRWSGCARVWARPGAPGCVHLDTATSTPPAAGCALPSCLAPAGWHSCNHSATQAPPRLSQTPQPDAATRHRLAANPTACTSSTQPPAAHL